MKLMRELLIGVGVGLFCFSLFLIGFQRESATELFYQEMVGVDDYFYRGQFYFNQLQEPHTYYNIDLAQYYYQQAILESGNSNELVWYQLGRIDFIQGKYESALFKFDRQIELFGSDTVPNVHYMKGLTYGFRARLTNNDADWERAAKEFTLFLEYEPDNPFALTDLAWVYFSMGDFDSMYEVTNGGVGVNMENPWLLNMHGLSLHQRGQSEDAYQFFTSALSLAEAMDVKDWGAAYPGNDPKVWEFGLEEFRSAIRFNRDLVQ